jgi:hypothetical protein
VVRPLGTSNKSGGRGLADRHTESPYLVLDKYHRVPTPPFSSLLGLPPPAMRPLPPLADSQRDEAGSVALTNGHGHPKPTRYIDVHSTQGSTTKSHCTVSVGINPTTPDQILPESGEIETSSLYRTLVGAHDTACLDNDIHAGGVALVMPGTCSSDDEDVVLWRVHAKSEYQTTQTDSEYDDDDDDDDDDDSEVNNGAPLHDVPMMTEIEDEVSVSSSDAMYSSVDEEKDGEYRGCYHGYDYGSGPGSNLPSASEPESEPESQSGSDPTSPIHTFDDYLQSLQHTHPDLTQLELADDSTSELSTQEMEVPEVPSLGLPQLQTQTPLGTAPHVPELMPDLDAAFVSIMNPFLPASYNHGLANFLLTWAELGNEKSSPRKLLPDPLSVTRQVSEGPAEITYNDLKGAECDYHA